MLKVKIGLFCSIICSFIFSGCSQNEISFLNAATSSPTSTPTMTQTSTPTLTSTPSMTPTATTTPTPSSTPYPLATCDDSKPYSATWTLEYGGMLFKAFLCQDNTLIVIFHNQEFSDPITINRKSRNNIEYSWEVFIDIDSDKSTGLPERNYTGIPGAEYILALSHWSSGNTKTVPFNEAFQKNVWEYDGESIKVISSAEVYADKTNKMIVLRGVIPEINPNSQLMFYRIHLNSDNKLSYRTEWVSSVPYP